MSRRHVLRPAGTGLFYIPVQERQMDDQYLSTCISGRQVPGAHILPCISLSPAKVHEYTKICLWLDFALDIFLHLP